MRFSAVASCVLMGLACIPDFGFAGGFEAGEQSARGIGMGGAFVAAQGDPTSLHINPAALSFLSGTHFSFGATIMLPQEKFTDVTPETVEWKSQAEVVFPPNLYITHTFSEGFGVGISIYVPYSNKTEWNPDWIGNHLVTKTEMRVVMVTPALSFKPTRRIALGIGFCIAFPKLLYEQRIPLTDPSMSIVIPDGYATYDAIGAPGFGIQAGVLFEPTDALTIGASYRSPIRFDLGESHIRYREIPSQLAAHYADVDFETSLALPDQMQAGLEWRPFSWMCASGEIQFTRWSSLQTIDLTYIQSLSLQRSLDMHWKNTRGSGMGLELTISDVAVRGGVRWEQTPIPEEWLSPGLLDADATIYSIGFGYRVADELLLDFAYAILKYEDRVVTRSALNYGVGGAGFNGRYVSSASAVALNVSYSWK